MEAVARRLGNTPAISRRCYVHPAVLDAYLDGVTLAAVRGPRRVRGLDREEAIVVGLLTRRLGRLPRHAAAAA